MELVNSALSQAMMGNQNGSRARPFSDKLRTLLYQDDRKRLNAVVGALLSKAEDGDLVAIKEVADRIEGKVITQVSVSTTNLTIDANLLSEAGKLLQLISGQIVDHADAVDAEIVEETNGQT